MTAQEPTFSAEEAATAQGQLRAALGLGPEAFPLSDFVGMISDEIDQFRTAGRSDADVAAVIEKATGRKVSAEAIARFYAPPEMRQHPHG